MFYGKIYNPSKTRVIDSATAETREAVAAILFDRNPKAKTVTTSKAYERNGEWHDMSSDIRWIDRAGYAPLTFGGTSVSKR